ncbi:FAD-dependent monooxygenase [Saccharopolyspora sp. HNM0986]|nr:FAD-dependent monooxygenase [Saccharopolyspora sp. HNM0986]
MAIVGGGIGGLTLAMALRGRGIRAEVHEQAPELREVGAAVALSANGTKLLRRLGVGDQLAECSAEPTELIYRHWQDGRRLAAHPAGKDYERRFGAPFYGIHRADLQRVLAGACGPQQVRLGSRITELTPGADKVGLTFADGSTSEADLVVGADGVHSQVRSLVTTEDPAVYSGTSGFRGLIPVSEMPQLPDPGAIQYWTGPGAHVLHYPIGDGSVVNFLAVVDAPHEWTSPTWTMATSRAEIAEFFAGWHPGVVEMVTATTLHQRWALFGQEPLGRWSRGRITLLGDAAHAMLPHHGQGANQTIEDAIALADLLAGHTDRTAALAAYERVRRARTRNVQRSSWVASELLHLPDGPRREARDRALNSELPAMLSWIHSHDAGIPPRLPG